MCVKNKFIRTVIPFLLSLMIVLPIFVSSYDVLASEDLASEGKITKTVTKTIEHPFFHEKHHSYCRKKDILIDHPKAIHYNILYSCAFKTQDIV